MVLSPFETRRISSIDLAVASQIKFASLAGHLRYLEQDEWDQGHNRCYQNRSSMPTSQPPGGAPRQPLCITFHWKISFVDTRNCVARPE